MALVGAVTFAHVQGPHYYLMPAGDLAPRSPMVAMTRFGRAVGQLALGPYEANGDVLPDDEAAPATTHDVARHEENTAQAAQCLELCASYVGRHELPMKLAQAFFSLDRQQLTFFFAAPGRVDFRDLLRDLVREFRTPIRLEQVGERDVARLLGAMGRCGREVCCRSWMPQFAPVSINHAREQGLPPLPTQLAGNCCRLRCCLRFELDDPDAPPRRLDPSRGDHRPVKTASFHTFWFGDDDTEYPRGGS